MPVRLTTLAAVLLCLSSVCASAQAPCDLVRSNCHDDNLTDRCDSEVQRAFFVVGYGIDMPAITFERQPGSRLLRR